MNSNDSLGQSDCVFAIKQWNLDWLDSCPFSWFSFALCGNCIKKDHYGG